MDKNFINKKIEFILNHLEDIGDYRNTTLEEIKQDKKTLKYIEKIIQELVDSAVDINQHILESNTKERAWSSKQSFFNLQSNVLQKNNISFAQDDLKSLIDTVSFRNEIVHSYDVNVYIIWSKRDLGVIIDIYKKYIEKIRELK